MKLLYIEDIAINATLLSMYVERLWGLKLEIAETAEAGLKKIKENKYDLIFMDINLPEMDGIEATRYIKNDMGHALLPILIVSANDLATTKDLALSAGANDYITKPVKIETLKSMVESHLVMR